MGKYLSIFIAILFFSCNKPEEKQEKLINQNQAISASSLGSEVTTSSGLRYIDEVIGTGPKPKAGDKITVHYTGKLIDGTKFDSSRDRDKPFEFTIGAGQVIKGWDEGLSTMNKGGKRKLIIPPELGYGQRGAGKIIPPGATLHFDVELIDIQEAFIDTDFSLPGKEEITDSGLRMIIHKEGNGDKPTTGQTLTVHYTGFLENGSKFDSSHDRNQPFKFPLGQGRVIRGWDEALSIMSKGEKRTVIIPPELGYGDKAKRKIPANSILIFEIELIDFQ